MQRLLERVHTESDDAPQVGDLIKQHLGDAAAAMPVVRAQFSAWDQANLQIALDHALAREGWSAQTVGMAGQARHFGGTGIGDIMRMPHFPAGSVEYAEAPVGPGRTLACIDFAVLLDQRRRAGRSRRSSTGASENPFQRASDIELQVAAGRPGAGRGAASPTCAP